MATGSHQPGYIGPQSAGIRRQVDRLATFGVAAPQMSCVAATLNQRLGTAFDFLTVQEAREALADHLA